MDRPSHSHYRPIVDEDGGDGVGADEASSSTADIVHTYTQPIRLSSAALVPYAQQQQRTSDAGQVLPAREDSEQSTPDSTSMLAPPDGPINRVPLANAAAQPADRTRPAAEVVPQWARESHSWSQRFIAACVMMCAIGIVSMIKSMLRTSFSQPASTDVVTKVFAAMLHILVAFSGVVSGWRRSPFLLQLFSWFFAADFVFVTAACITSMTAESWKSVSEIVVLFAQFMAYIFVAYTCWMLRSAVRLEHIIQNNPTIRRALFQMQNASSTDADAELPHIPSECIAELAHLLGSTTDEVTRALVLYRNDITLAAAHIVVVRDCKSKYHVKDTHSDETEMLNAFRTVP